MFSSGLNPTNDIWEMYKRCLINPMTRDLEKLLNISLLSILLHVLALVNRTDFELSVQLRLNLVKASLKMPEGVWSAVRRQFWPQHFPEC